MNTTPDLKWRCPDCGHDANHNHRGCIIDMMAHRVIRDTLIQANAMAALLRNASNVLRSFSNDDTDECDYWRELADKSDAMVSTDERTHYIPAREAPGEPYEFT